MYGETSAFSNWFVGGNTNGWSGKTGCAACPFGASFPRVFRAAFRCAVRTRVVVMSEDLNTVAWSDVGQPLAGQSPYGIHAVDQRGHQGSA